MKSRMVAALLALLLGGVGMHKFYLGKPLQGVLYLVFCWTFIPALISLVEGIMLLLQSDEAFNAKHNGGAIMVGGAQVATPETHVKCPDCRELVLRDARKCKHCGSQLVPQV